MNIYGIIWFVLLVGFQVGIMTGVGIVHFNTRIDSHCWLLAIAEVIGALLSVSLVGTVLYYADKSEKKQ